MFPLMMPVAGGFYCAHDCQPQRLRAGPPPRTCLYLSISISISISIYIFIYIDIYIYTHTYRLYYSYISTYVDIYIHVYIDIQAMIHIGRQSAARFNTDLCVSLA